MRCAGEIAPRLSNIKAGHGACKFCAGVGRRPRAIADEEAVAVMAAAGLNALEPYPGRTQAFWRMQCLSCKDVMMTTLANVKRNVRGCPTCATHGLDASLPALLYLIVNPKTGETRVGVTGLDLTTRLGRFLHEGWQIDHMRYFPSVNEALRAEQRIITRGLHAFTYDREMLDSVLEQADEVNPAVPLLDLQDPSTSQ
jgi:hypothetical protein